MTPRRFETITSRYQELNIAVMGDFSLDRYLEIDPRLNEKSIETGRPVHNVTNVRSQPGSAGTIVNNLSALGIGRIFPIGFCGRDGEGFELMAALKSLPNVDLRWFTRTTARRTFTYCKPLVMKPGHAPKELNRLDSKNWTHTPRSVEQKMVASLTKAAEFVDAVILMDQVDIPESGVITRNVLEFVGKLIHEHRRCPLMLADSRRGLGSFPPVVFKMNQAELDLLTGHASSNRLDTVKNRASRLARRNDRPVFITMAEKGILGAPPKGKPHHELARPVNGEIDIVGAGDAVTANLTSALASGATIGESIALANAAAHIVVHQLGTTGTAAIHQLRDTMFP